MLSVIQNRRSIRAFLDKPVSRELVEKILLAGSLAPSSKNRQPWRFIVAAGTEKEELLAAMDRGLERERQSPLLPGSGDHLSGAENTRRIMAQAPVVILVMNPLGLPLDRDLTPEERVYEICNAQSLGAAMENISLAAESLGLGSLWICDTYFAYQELMEWAGGTGELFAALALGYPGEAPPSRPRKPLSEIVEWRGGSKAGVFR
ncbi:MAG: nitroreductase [Angelakisella sp.]|jgi:nitroreductase|nr:nitroreductase [Angelakisella sp.]